MKNIVSALLSLILLVTFGFYVSVTYKDQVRVYPKKEPQVVETSVLIEEKEYMSVLEGLKMPIDNVTWVDEDTVRFETDSKERYEYRLSTKTLTSVDKQQGSLEIALPSEARLSYDEAGSLIYTQGDKATEVDPSLTRGTQAQWVLAPDQKKIVFVDPASGKLKVFLFSKRKIFTSAEPVSPLAKSDLKQAIGFSPDSGYFYIVSSRDLAEGASFSVYGADSAKGYAKDIMGFSPVWAPGKLLKLAYHYTESIEKLTGAAPAELAYVPDKVGLFDIRTKKASYLTLPDKGKFFGPMIWLEGELLSTLTDGSGNALGLYRYAVKEKKGILKAFEAPIKLSDFQEIKASGIDAKASFFYRTGQVSFAAVLQGAESILLDPVQGFDLNGNLTGACFTPYGLLYYTGQKLYLQRVDDVKVLLDVEKAVFSIVPSPLGNRLFVQLTLLGTTQILVLNLDLL